MCYFKWGCQKDPRLPVVQVTLYMSGKLDTIFILKPHSSILLLTIGLPPVFLDTVWITTVCSCTAATWSLWSDCFGKWWARSGNLEKCFIWCIFENGATRLVSIEHLSTKSDLSVHRYIKVWVWQHEWFCAESSAVFAGHSVYICYIY